MNFKEIETPWPRERETPKPRESALYRNVGGRDRDRER